MFLKDTFFEYANDEITKSVADSLSVLAKSVAGQPVNRDRRNDSKIIIGGVQKEMQSHTAYMQAAAHIIHMTSEDRKEASLKVEALGLLPKIKNLKQLKAKN